MRRYKHKNGHWVGWFHDETYRAYVRVLWPVNGQQVSDYVKDEFGIDYKASDTFGAKCVEVVHPDGCHSNIICLREWARRPDATDISFLAHEVFHAAEHILSDRGIRLVSDVTTEPYAYLIESIMRRCLILLDTKKRLRK